MIATLATIVHLDHGLPVLLRLNLQLVLSALQELTAPRVQPARFLVTLATIQPPLDDDLSLTAFSVLQATTAQARLLPALKVNAQLVTTALVVRPHRLRTLLQQAIMPQPALQFRLGANLATSLQLLRPLAVLLALKATTVPPLPPQLQLSAPKAPTAPLAAPTLCLAPSVPTTPALELSVRLPAQPVELDNTAAVRMPLLSLAPVPLVTSAIVTL